MSFYPDYSWGSYSVDKCSKAFICPHAVRCSFRDGSRSFTRWIDLIFQIFIFNLKFIFLYLAVFSLIYWVWIIENKQKKSKTLHPSRSGSDSHMEKITSKSIGIFLIFSIKLLSLLFLNRRSLFLNFTVNVGILNEFFLFESLLFLN